MKTVRFLFVAVFAAAMSLLPLRAQDKAALAAFKAEIEAIEKYSKEEEAKLKDNPLGGVAMIRSIIGKAQAVKTDGLPDDLKATYKDFTTVLAKMGDIFKGWPDKVDEMTAFIEKKAVDDPKFMADFGTKMAALEAEMKPITAKLDELGKKYGLDGLGALLGD